jgi:hypothetical protein
MYENLRRDTTRPVQEFLMLRDELYAYKSVFVVSLTVAFQAFEFVETSDFSPNAGY